MPTPHQFCTPPAVSPTADPDGSTVGVLGGCSPSCQWALIEAKARNARLFRADAKYFRSLGNEKAARMPNELVPRVNALIAEYRERLRHDPDTWTCGR